MAAMPPMSSQTRALKRSPELWRQGGSTCHWCQGELLLTGARVTEGSLFRQFFDGEHFGWEPAVFSSEPEFGGRVWKSEGLTPPRKSAWMVPSRD